MADPGEYIYRRINHYEYTESGGTPSTVGGHAVTDSSERHFALQIADGDGGDSTFGLPEKYLSNHYTYGHTHRHRY